MTRKDKLVAFRKRGKESNKFSIYEKDIFVNSFDSAGSTSYTKYMASVEAGRNAIKKLGLKGFNKPKLTPSHPKKKAVVVGKEGNVTKVIRFGAKGYGHNYSDTARKSYLARSAGIKGVNSKLSANYHARKFLWAGKGGSKTNPKK